MRKITYLFILLLSAQICNASIINVPYEQPTIQAGIDTAADGDTVLIWPGTYSGEGNTDLRIVDKPIVVKGAYGPDSTIIDCGGLRGFYFDYYSYADSNTILDGLTITNGLEGLLIFAATPKLLNLRISNNYNGIHNVIEDLDADEFLKSDDRIDDRIHLRNCEFLDNTNYGIRFCGGWTALLVLEDCLFSGNNVTGACLSPSSGAIYKRCNFIDIGIGIENYYSHPSTVLVDSCYFESCGAAVYGDVTMTNSTIVNCSMGVGGSAFWQTEYTVINCLLEGNTGTAFGRAHGVIKDCIIRNNPGYVGSVNSGEYEEASLSFSNCQIYNNGYGIYAEDYGDGAFINLDSCLYYNNSGPIHIIGSGNMNVNNCTFVENNSDVIFMSYWTSADYTIQNTIIVSNNGRGIYKKDYCRATITALCSDVYDNSDGNYIGIPDQTGLNGNISENPLFCLDDNISYNISLASPCAPSNNDCGVLMGAGEALDCQPGAIISIDRSGSMYYTDPLGQSRLDRAKSMAHTEIDRLLAIDDSLYPGLYLVAVQYFNADGIVLLQDFTIDSALLHNAIDAIPRPKHDTPLAAAMCQAHCLIRAEDFRDRNVITFTDGLENESQYFDMCPICEPCNDLIETGWKYDCNPSDPETCSEWQLCLADQFVSTGVNLVHYFGEPINPFDKSNEGLEDMYFLKSTAEESSGGFFYHSDQEADGYICGDANRDFTVNVSDAAWLVNYVFAGGGSPDPYEAGDANCDGLCNISDAVWLINYVFVGGKQPCDLDGDTIPDC
jgi:hypothetical protein